MPSPEQTDPPTAQVAVDVPLSHLDRPFDYAVLPDQDAAAVPGARVRVRFAGRLRDGYVLGRGASSEHTGPLTPLHKVVSAEPVLTGEVAGLVRAVADHYAGTFADVVRLAVPPRHAATEQAAPGVERPGLPEHSDPAGPLARYPSGAGFLAALRGGGAPRAVWQLTPTAAPVGDWALGLAAAARACVDGGRGAVLVVPDQRDLDRLATACAELLGPAGFAVLVAENGPAARYRAFLAALRGEVGVVIGNRAAAYAPVSRPGLLAVWDSGDDLLAERRAPYPHTRDVLALRAARTGAGLLYAGYSRPAELQAWVDRGWLRPITGERTEVRHAAPRVRVTGDSDIALARDPAGRQARLPHEVFELMRATLPQGPVLVQVPRGGYLAALVCQDCREPARCRYCSGPVRADRAAAAGDAGWPGSAGGRRMECSWCGRPQLDWSCPICGSGRVRAPVVGVERTAEELGRAFPQTPVRQSTGGRRTRLVPCGPAIVVATPGAEPPADGGYAGAVLLDTAALLLRADLRAGEEALRRWLNAVALVRGGDDGGSVIAVGDSAGRALQALVRLDPAGFAARELADRAEAHFPPAARVVVAEGGAAAVAEFVELLRAPPGTELLGPVDVPPAGPAEEPLSRLTVRAPAAAGDALARAAKQVASVRSARKSDGALRIMVDPASLG